METRRCYLHGMQDAGRKPRNAAATRDAIVQAARAAFARESYDNVGVRDIAAAAGVDAALVCRYVGSKEELFAAALRSSGDPSVLFRGERRDFGERVARLVIEEPRSAHKLEPMLIMLRSASSPKAAALVEQSLQERFFAPMAAWLGGEQAEVRARLIGGLVMGMSLLRDGASGYGLPAETQEELVKRLAGMLQACVDGP